LASLRVPERFISGILKIAEISEQGFAELLSALKVAPEMRDTVELSAWIADDTPSIIGVDREQILKAVTPMFRVRRTTEVSVKEFAADVWTAIQEEAADKTAGLDADLFRTRIEQLMALSSLDLLDSKIAELKQELEKSFCRARVLTDLRPVFSEDIERSPSAMVVLHTLQIGYHDGMGDHNEFYVTLDQSGIETLKKVLDRASAKAETLKDVVNKADIRFIG